MLSSPKPLCLCPMKISSSRIVSHLRPNPFPSLLPQLWMGSPTISPLLHRRKLHWIPSYFPQTLPKCSWTWRWSSVSSLWKAFISWSATHSIKVGSAQQQQESTVVLWSQHRTVSCSLSLPKICLFTKSFYISRLSMGLRKHEYCSFISDLLWRC